MPFEEAVGTRRGEPTTKTLVLVTGAGRSGTSTVAGTLHHLGLHVPLPVLKPNPSNPMGFFESTWPLWFHRRLMDTAFIEQTDGRPEAADKMAAAVTPEVRAELRDWLAEAAATADQVLVKDPRSVWVPWLWEETAAELGIGTGFLTMVRHPAEVVGSRSTYYRDYRPSLDDWSFSVMNLCGWVNGNLVVERQTRGKPRVVLRYEDLVADWRACMREVRDTFGLSFNDDLDPGHRHPADDFVDPSLRRHEAQWSGWDLPEQLVDIAEGVFGQMGRLADSGGSHPKAEARMTELGEEYARLMRVSQAIARDTTGTAAKAARVAGAEEVRKELELKLDQARARNERLSAELDRAREAGPARRAFGRAYRVARRAVGRGRP